MHNEIVGFWTKLDIVSKKVFLIQIRQNYIKKRVSRD